MLFRNPTMPRGYPIPRRAKPGAGLKIPLNMMAGLGQTQRVNTFGSKPFIKWFLAILVLTKRNRDDLALGT